MINEQQQEQASLYALGALTPLERAAFEAELQASTELREFVRSIQRTTDLFGLSAPSVSLPAGLREKILQRIQTRPSPHAPSLADSAIPGLRFVDASDTIGWKELPVRGAWIKLLSLDRARGYAVMLGKLDPGVRYPAHINAGPEDFCILTGDLHVSGKALRPGDFHHADAGSEHGENYSIEGCTLIAVLTADNPLVEFAKT